MSKPWRECEKESLEAYRRYIHRRHKAPKTVDAFTAGFRYCWGFATRGPEKMMATIADFEPALPLPPPNDDLGEAHPPWREPEEDADEPEGEAEPEPPPAEATAPKDGETPKGDA